MIERYIIKGSESDFSGSEFFLDVLAELFEGDGFSVISSNSVDDFPKLFFGESVLELIVDIFEFIDGEFSSSL